MACCTTADPKKKPRQHETVGLFEGAHHRGVSADGAGNEIRTRDLNLGKVALYQLSYSRIFDSVGANFFRTSTEWLLDLGSNQGPTD
jgi:hypothetical protein